jgi:predicted translin family RNA/ssDNA-binding protein
VASLAALIERAHATREEAQLVRSETVRLSHESAAAARQLAEQRRSLEDAMAHSQAMRRSLPTWPAWAPPDSAELKLTLVPLE